MNSEESFNSYHSHEVPDVTTEDTPSHTVNAQTIESPPITKRRRAWMLLILPSVCLLTITALLCVMLLWLLYRRAGFDSSFSSLNNDALIVDEAAQWCQLSAMVGRANCDQEQQTQNLIGLTLSGLLVSDPIYPTS